MSRGWRQYLEDRNEDRRDRLRKTEKIRKEKRSVRGRTEDDWIVEESLAEGESLEERLAAVTKLGYRVGRVIEVHKRHVFVAEEKEEGKPDTGLLWLCTVAKRHFQRAHKERNFVVVGDRVLFEADSKEKLDDSGEPTESDLPRGLIQHGFRRKSKIARRDPMRPDWEHVMLANIDLVAIVASVLNPEVRWGLIDRLLVQAEDQGIEAVIVLNKIDLLETEDRARPEFVANIRRRIDIYRSVGYNVLEVSALRPKKTQPAIKKLRELFKGKLIGLSGHSGVGKSSIVNLMKPEFEQVVDENPDIFYKGRHTTTYNSLLRTDIGGYVIDTPGVRSFAFGSWSAIELSHCFREFRGIRCKYMECTHDHEPGCGVKAAVEEGRISRERYRSYIGILKGVSLREGETMEGESALEADLRARQSASDKAMAEMGLLNNENEKSSK